MAQAARLLVAVQEVLFREWDPIGVNDNDRCRNEYDSYAATIAKWLWEGADEYKLVAYLAQVQHVSMGLSQVDHERDVRVARKLLRLAHGSD